MALLAECLGAVAGAAVSLNPGTRCQKLYFSLDYHLCMERKDCSRLENFSSPVLRPRAKPSQRLLAHS